MKKVLTLIPILSGLLLADSMSQINDIDVTEYLNYDGRLVFNDKTCEKEDIKKLLTLTELTITREYINPFYLDVCTPFSKLYKLRKDKESEQTYSKYNRLMQEYSKSFYVNYYTFIYNKYLPNVVNFDLFRNKKDEISKYMIFYEDRPFDDPVRRLKTNYFKYMYTSGQDFLNVESSVLFTRVYQDILVFLRTPGNEVNLKKFLNKLIKMKEGRGLDTSMEFLEIANVMFNETIFDILEKDYHRDSIMLNLMKSYKKRKDPKQIILMNKILIKDLYISLQTEYPSDLSNLNEHSYIMETFDKIKELKLSIHGKYYYETLINVFLYKKLIYVQNTDLNQGLAEKEIRKLINQETDKDLIREYYNLIDDIKNDRFVKVKIPDFL